MEGEEEGQPLLLSDEGGTRTLTAFKLDMIGYFLTCGGPFGIEPSIGVAGPLYVFIGIIVVLFIYSLPQALMSAELSLLFRKNGGSIVWVQLAFGDFLAWVNAYNFIGSYIASPAAMVVLFVNYLQIDDLTWWESIILKAGFVLIVIFVNIVGLDLVARLSFLFMLIINIPFYIEFIYVLINHDSFDTNPSSLLSHPKAFKDIDWGTYLSVLVYSFGGFDNLGNFAGEIKGGKSAFILGILGGLPLAMGTYFIPISTSWFIEPHTHIWLQDGAFTKIAKHANVWLYRVMVVGSVLSNFGLVNLIAMVSRAAWAMARQTGSSKKLPSFVAYSWHTSSGVAKPVAAILILSGLSFVLGISLEYTELVLLTFVLRSVNLVLEYAAVIWLKITMRGVKRGFEMPGGLPGAIVLSLPTLALIIIVLATGKTKIVLAGVVFNVVIIALYWIQLAVRFLLYGREGVQQDPTPPEIEPEIHASIN